MSAQSMLQISLSDELSETLVARRAEPKMMLLDRFSAMPLLGKVC